MTAHGAHADVAEVWDDFRAAVDMSPKELEDRLETDESQQVGDRSGGGESTGHESGRRIVELLRLRKRELTDDDAAHMRKVGGYVARHTAQRPDESDDELAHTPWTASLKNWGHDPLKG